MNSLLQNQNPLPGGQQSDPTRVALAPKSRQNPGSRKTAPVINNASFSIIIAEIGTISIEVLPADNRRAYLCIQNPNVGQSIFINFDSAATVGHKEIIGGGSWEPNVAPINSIQIIGVVNGLEAIITQGLKRD